jgi:multicomponent Na+:H+ antiporter subunit E
MKLLQFKKRVVNMRKKSFILFALLLIFVLVISAESDNQHILAGVLISLITVWFWQDLGPRLPVILTAKEMLGLGRCLVLLVWYIVDSNITVAKTLLFSKGQVNPVVIVMQPDIKSNWGRVLLATCITITPGTVTIDVDPETGRFIVHALTEEIADGLINWQMIDEIKKLEIRIKRGARHVVDTDRTHNLDTPSTAAGDYRSDSH